MYVINYFYFKNQFKYWGTNSYFKNITATEVLITFPQH